MVVKVRPDVLAETDGPMLKHGLQDMHDVPLVMPNRRVDRPNQQAIEARYQKFLMTA
jgi:putative restriction endonuclease